MYIRLLLIPVLFYITINAQQLNNPSIVVNTTDKKFFIQNKGQWNPEVKYLTHINGMNAWITNSGVVYDYYRINKNIDKIKTNKLSPEEKGDYENQNTTIQGHVVRMLLINSENDVPSMGYKRLDGYYNYFLGNDRSKWTSFVPLYESVELEGVYKNIDIKYYYDNGMLRYDYQANPGADLSQIKFKFTGQDAVSINIKGELILKTSIGEVTIGKIYAYQVEGRKQSKIECKFELKEDSSVGIKAGAYDENKELIIDPLVYSTFIGGIYASVGNSIAIDSGGNAYITGWNESLDFPTTTGAYLTTLKGLQNSFVTKLNSSGSALIFSTFIGGDTQDQSNSIAVDSGGNAYITGWTNSSNYPTTPGAFQTILRGAQNVFITKLNSSGSTLIYSTYIGGTGITYMGDRGASLAIDQKGNAYITGTTWSSDFPTTKGAYQTALNGTNNVFVTKLNSSGSALIYSTFIGGISQDQSNSVALDSSGNAYITGWTNSSNYPVTSGAYQTALIGAQNVFVTKLNSTGSALVYSTYIRGDGSYANSIAIDASGNAYLTGFTASFNYPTTTGAYQSSLTGIWNTFVTKLNSTGSTLIYSTYIGGNYEDYGNSIAVDPSGYACITGYTISTNYPTTKGAYQSSFQGGADVFVTKLNSNGSALIYSTFIGGSGNDQGNSLTMDSNGNVYVTGFTYSANFPSTVGAFQDILGGQQNVFVTKLYTTPSYINSSTPRALARIDINNLNALEANNGFSDYNENSNLEGLEFPKGSGKAAVYKSGFLWGAFVPGDPQVRVGGSEYGSGLQPGPIMTDGQAADPNDFRWSIYRVRPDIYHNGPAIDLTNDALIEDTTAAAVRSQYESDWAHWPAAGTANDLGAPFKDVNGDGKYEPGIDIPGVPGASQTIYYVVNDMNSINTQSLFGTDPMGLEIHVTLWAYAQQGALNNTYFKKWLIINKGYQHYTLDSMFVSFWADVDLGNPRDDLVGCDTTLGLSFTYNGRAIDAVYDPLPPPAAGFSLLQGPVVKGTKTDSATVNGKKVVGEKNLAISAAYFFINSDRNFGDPPAGISTGSTQYYRFFNGQYGLSGLPFRDNQNNITKFAFYGDPVTGTGWLDSTLADKRQGFASGPFTLAPGDSQEVVVAEIFAGAIPDVNYLQAVSLLKTYDLSILTGYDILTGIVSPVVKPEATIKEFSLSQNYPNPFNPTTIISWQLAVGSFVTLKVYDVLGREVKILVNEFQETGTHSINFDATKLASGIYFYQLKAGNFVSTKKMILLK